MPSNKTNSTKKPATSERQNRGDSVNQVTLIGRLVATPELRETDSGKHVTTVLVATNGKSQAEFHDVVFWGQLADFACSYLGKGRLVYLYRGTTPEPPVAGHRREHSTNRRDRRQPAPGALQECLGRAGCLAARPLGSSLFLGGHCSAEGELSCANARMPPRVTPVCDTSCMEDDRETLPEASLRVFGPSTVAPGAGVLAATRTLGQVQS